MATLKTTFAGVSMPNPFMLASAPPTTNCEMVARSFDAGWGGAVLKTMAYDLRMARNVNPRIAAYKVGKSIHGFTNFELGSPKPISKWLEDARWLKERFPEHAVFVSLLHTEGLVEEQWREVTRMFNDAGIDGFELNFSCSHAFHAAGGGFAKVFDVQNKRFSTISCTRCGDTELYRAFDMTYDYDIWPFYEGFLKGELSLRAYTDILNYQELTYPTGYVKARCVENHDTPRLASYLSDDRQLQNWLAFLYFRRGAAMLYGGTEFACRHQVSLFDKDDNFGDKARDLSDLLRRCKAMKTTLPLTGAVWYDCRVGAAIGHYDGPEGTALGVFDLSGSAASIPVDLPDGTYENRLGGTVTVTDGQLPVESTPVVI